MAAQPVAPACGLVGEVGLNGHRIRAGLRADAAVGGDSGIGGDSGTGENGHAASVEQRRRTFESAAQVTTLIGCVAPAVTPHDPQSMTFRLVQPVPYLSEWMACTCSASKTHPIHVWTITDR
ncbi:hypothetical protein GCM10025863_09620 [Microbacterium suwonense]|uniref:Uncharacterized protein n=1 Tax=Microbacterium suwonense TaxID=683047 RepID=A0ABN6X2I0_9MICO|nr:hypothetical protein GCM10025863_09620 [Microbacterium suwonense]